MSGAVEHGDVVALHFFLLLVRPGLFVRQHVVAPARLRDRAALHVDCDSVHAFAFLLSLHADGPDRRLAIGALVGIGDDAVAHSATLGGQFPAR